MSRMAEINMEKHLRSAVKQMTPVCAETVWQQPVERATGDEWYLKKEAKSTSNRGKLVRFLASSAACLVICISAVGLMDHRKDATVYLDVNPSVELQINSRDKVLSANGENADGEVILGDMDLKGTDLDVALNAIIGSMVQHGYLNEAQKMILLSVDSKNEQRAKVLRQQISTELNANLASFLGSGSVLDQSVAATDELKQLAQQYEITPGKALLLQRLTEENPNLDYEKLAKLPMNELVDYLKQSGVDVRNYVHCTGGDLDDEDDLVDELDDLIDDDDPDDVEDEDGEGDEDEDDESDDPDDDDDDVDSTDDDDDDIDDEEEEKEALHQRPTKTDTKKNVSANRDIDNEDEAEENEPEEDEEEDEENEPDEDENEPDEDEDND